MQSLLRRFVAALAPVLLVALPTLGHAESLGAYVHNTLRENDEKLIICYDVASAMAAAEAVNREMLAIHDAFVSAPDDLARQTLFQEQLYPSEGWGVMLAAIRDLRCDLIDVASHISRRTVLMGPEELRANGLAHHVVQTDILAGTGDGAVPVWIITTQDVPAGNG